MTVAANNGSSLAPATIDLGTDCEGQEHVYRRSTHSVYVIDGSDVVRRQPLRGSHLNDWMAFIAEEFGGWADARYGVWAYDKTHQVGRNSRGR